LVFSSFVNEKINNFVEILSVKEDSFEFSIKSNFLQWNGYYLACLNTTETYCELITEKLKNYTIENNLRELVKIKISHN
jgi:hypothetical protein